ncbi:MAG: succinylglutamate desuccinylase/aspartoacylase [uncultured bacterium (gcode 4)]|uniref:Succinylglutamate desuccinylase/aspartoacylase n=1 Tax=uncultured bacterium (gcode 4) TaxID=1234023 RepID=K1Z4T3_9BACT|nr:MAG: succinylglutamate desuccinylase/aspartoacylase [uncultured bacterium (gcode 4)]
MKIVPKYEWIIWLYLIDSENPWPTVAIFSWIHWDEISGIRAAKKLLSDIRTWKIPIRKGRIMLLIWANRKAIKAGKRYMRDNLNRLFIDEIKGEWYEYERSKELKEVLKKCEYILDLHSTSWLSVPYIMTEKKHVPFAKKLWIPTMVVWWGQLGSAFITGDTDGYINSHWWVWFTFEAWDHLSPEWAKNAYRISLNYLSILKLIDESHFQEIAGDRKYVKMENIYICESGAFEFRLPLPENFQPIRKGVLIWMDGNKEVRAEKDMILVMPNIANPKKWEDVFFIGKLLK